MAEEQKSIGALWLKESANGKKYMTGNVEINGVKLPIVVFKNNKSTDNQPDYRIFKSQPQKKQEDNSEVPF